MQKKKIIIWSKNIDKFIQGDDNFGGGITVQMYLWSKVFLKNNWHVYSISSTKKSTIEDIKFLKISSNVRFSIVSDLILIFYNLVKTRPDVIFFRGASRNLGLIAIISKLLKIKIIFLGAHDTDFETNNEIIKYDHNKKLYQFGLKNISCFIVQNDVQEKHLIRNYKKENFLLIPNIWLSNLRQENYNINMSNYFLWVSNFHERKRPEYFIMLAKNYPQYKFVMVGGPANKMLFDKCKAQSSKIANLEFLGPKSFWFVNKLFENAKIFICTSESEGFPNTFLQSWTNAIPVISTFDPSNTIEKNKLGMVVKNLDELYSSISQIETEKNKLSYKDNIDKYFKENHNGNSNYIKIIKQFNLA